MIQEQPQIFSTQLDQKHVEISSGEHPGGHDARKSDVQRELLMWSGGIVFIELVLSPLLENLPAITWLRGKSMEIRVWLIGHWSGMVFAGSLFLIVACQLVWLFVGFPLSNRVCGFPVT